MGGCGFWSGDVPERQPGFDFAPFDFAATRRDVDGAMANFALQVPLKILGKQTIFDF